MISSFQIVKPWLPLRKFIQRIFVIESSGRLPAEDLKVIVPNACPKLVVPFRNGLVGTTKGWTRQTKENSIAFIGVSDIAAHVDYIADAPAGNITVEFSPIGAYRFFDIHWLEMKNSIYDLSEIFSSMSRDLETKLVDSYDISCKVEILQSFLLEMLKKSKPDDIFEYCVTRIMSSKGRVTISRLEKETGYSSRWLNIKFHNRLGISPKNLASIVRFQEYYKSLVSDKEMFFFKKEFYNYYYDQSHFIKDFKRFTGHAPLLFGNSSNAYDSVFYKG